MRRRIEVEKLGTNPIINIAAAVDQMKAWMDALSTRNAIDEAIYSYPSVFYLQAHRGETNTLYMPVQPCFIYESLAINPANSAADTAESLNALFTVMHHKAVEQGQGESYFLCSDKQTCAFAEHQGMENLTDNERLNSVIEAAAHVVNSQSGEQLEQAQALGRLDIALNEYKKNPGLKTYRVRHIRPKENTEAQSSKSGEKQCMHVAT